MPARTVLLGLIAAAAGFGTAGSPGLRAEPQKMRQAASSGDTFRASIPGKFLLPAKIAASGGVRIERPAGMLASAMRPLDLSKLSMSDFGDTEQSH